MLGGDFHEGMQGVYGEDPSTRYRLTVVKVREKRVCGKKEGGGLGGLKKERLETNETKKMTSRRREISLCQYIAVE